jgi:hypothetical protein
MTRCPISFPDGSVTFPEEELDEVPPSRAQRVHEARGAGAWVFGAGVQAKDAAVVGTDGSVTALPYRRDDNELGGFSIVDVEIQEESLRWAEKIAAACRSLPQCARAHV